MQSFKRKLKAFPLWRGWRGVGGGTKRKPPPFELKGIKNLIKILNSSVVTLLDNKLKLTLLTSVSDDEEQYYTYITNETYSCNL